MFVVSHFLFVCFFQAPVLLEILNKLKNTALQIYPQVTKVDVFFIQIPMLNHTYMNCGYTRGQMHLQIQVILGNDNGIRS